MLTQRGLRPIGRGAWAAPFESIAPRVVARYGGAEADPDAGANIDEDPEGQFGREQSAAVTPRAPASNPAPTGSGAPLLFDRWERDIRAVAATPLTAARPLAVAIFPRIAGLDYRLETAGGTAVLNALTTRVGERFIAPRPEAVPVGPRASGASPAPQILQGSRPAHVAQRGTPAPLPRELERLTVRLSSQRPSPRVASWDAGQPLHVFAPDTRRVFSDTSYPWSACGLIPEVGASGAMVGPRHVLTAAHALNITGGNLAAMSFVPLSFDGHPPPFGSANVTRAYYFTRTTTNSLTNQQVAFDYAVCVLDRRLGDLTGWLGSRTYANQWNGGAYFAHVGYPFDIAGGRRPVFHGPGVIDSSPSESFGGRTGLRLLHQNDIEPGDSGGPFFGWWSGNPYIIGVQSGHDAAAAPPYTPNLAGGGAPLVELIQYAISANP